MRRFPPASRQLALLFLAIVTPCAVLIALGGRMIVQERELADKRNADERRAAASALGGFLLARLEQLRAAGSSDRLALIARRDGEEIVLPWERDSASMRFRNLAAEPRFARLLGHAERAEAAGRLDSATNAFRSAADASHDIALRSVAELGLARALEKSGQVDASRELYRRLADRDASLRDEHGVPFAMYALYALERTSHDSIGRARLSERLISLEASREWIGPVECAFFDRLARSLAVTSARPCVADAEQATTLQREFKRLPTAHDERVRAWTAFGSPLWLVSRGREPDVVAVRGDSVLADVVRTASLSVRPRSLVRVDEDPAAEPLGAAFPGVGVKYATAAMPGSPLRAFYATAVVTAIVVLAVGGYLAWRDVHREVRLASMRAQFASSVSHELKTPLTSIRMFAEALQEGGQEPGTARDYLAIIVGESERLTRLLNNVLDATRIDEGEKRYRLAPLAVRDVVCTAVATMKYQLAQHGFDLAVALEDGGARCNGDADALEQAILNLLANAMKYSGASRRIEIATSVDASRVQVSVRDFGIGIPPDEQNRIFQKFFRGEAAAAARIPGAGIGLTIVDHIIRGHDGELVVESAVGEGSRFAFRLPRIEGAA